MRGDRACVWCGNDEEDDLLLVQSPGGGAVDECLIGPDCALRSWRRDRPPGEPPKERK